MKYLQKEDIYGGLSLEKHETLVCGQDLVKLVKHPKKKKNINIKVIINTIRKQVHGRDTWHTRVNIV